MTKPITILILDDRADNRAVLVAMLGHLKYRLLEAAGGEEALALVRKEKPDLVIADVLMPKMDGYEFVERLRNDPKTAGTKVIFYTASYIEDEARTLAKGCGVEHVIVKPAEPEAVLKVVADALQTRPRPVAATTAEFQREHLHLVSDKLANKVEELELLTGKLEREVAEHAAARATLDRLRRHHELILNSAGEGICGVDLEGQIIFANPKAADLLGWRVEELLGQPEHATIHHTEADGRSYSVETCPIHLSLSDGGTRRITNDVFCQKDGTRFRVDYVVAPTKDDAGQIRGAIVTFKDITDQFMAEARLKLQEQQYRLLFQTNPNPMWVFDTTTLGILAANEAASELYGYSPAEFLGLGLQDLRPEADVPELMQALSGSRAPAHFSGQFRHQKKDGTPIAVEVYSAALVWAGVASRIVTAIDVTERKSIQEELRSTHERLRALLAHTPGVIYSLRIDGDTVVPVFVSENVERLLGAASAEVSFDWWSRSLHPDDRDRVQEVLRQTLQGDGSTTEYRLRHRDGSYRWVHEENRVIRDANGQPAELVGVWVDITEQKEAEKALRESERRFREMLENVDFIAMTLDASGIVTFCNDSFLRLTGWQRDEVIGQDYFARFIPPSESAVKDLFFELIKKGEILSHRENPIQTKTGELREVAWNNTMLRDPSGRVIGTASLGEDVTDRNRASARIRELSDIIDRAQDAIIIRDFESDRITVWNRGAERLYGWSAGEAIGRPLRELIISETTERESRLRQLVATGEFFGEIKHHTKDGKEVVVDSRVTLIRDHEGAPRAVLGINTDITERKKLETQLLRSQRLESIGTLAGGVAHDLNNILTPILICAEILREQTEKEDALNAISLIEQSARRGAGVVKQVLTFARGVEGERVVINPSHLIDEMVDIARKTFPKSIQITARYPEDIWPTRADPTQLHQVLLNLSVNARDAMPEGGSLTISGENVDIDEAYAAMLPGAVVGPHVLLQVSDSGAGMSRAVIDKIFDPFFTTKEAGKGTGLGLSTSLGIVKSHGGFLSVSSEPGRGTTFRIHLPAIRSDGEVTGTDGAEKIIKGNNETILLVDDEESIRRVTRMLLEKNNYRVLEAGDGPETLALLAQHADSIKVIMTDLMLPYMDGVAVIRAAKKIKPNLICIVCSGEGASFRSIELQSLGVTKTLAKPYDAGALLRILRDALANGPRRASDVGA